jgi:hypothetical protein
LHRQKITPALLAIAAFMPCSHLLAQPAEDSWKDLMTQGQHLAASSDPARAEQIFLKAVHEAERFGQDDWRVGLTLESLGQVYSTEKKFNEGEVALRRSLRILQTADGDDSNEVANVNLDLARMMLANGRSADAILFARKTLNVYERILGGTDLQTASVMCLIGDSLRTMKNYVDAETQLRRCADIRESTGGIESVELADALYSLAMTYTGERKFHLAEPVFRLTETIREKQLGLTSPLLAQTMEDHAALLRTMGKDTEARRLTLLVDAIRRSDKKAVVRYSENTH